MILLLRFPFFFISSSPTRYQQPIRNHLPIGLCLFENQHPSAYRPTDNSPMVSISRLGIILSHSVYMDRWQHDYMDRWQHDVITTRTHRVQDHWKPSWSQAALRGGHSARSSWLGFQLPAACQWTSTSLAIFSPLQVALIHILHVLFSFALQAL